MSYITKKQKDIQTKNTDAKIQMLLNMFGNFIIQKRGLKGDVTKEELKEFVGLLEKK
jgi:hypothetical protein